MKNRALLIGVLSLSMFASLAGQDVKVLEGGPENGGIIENTINGEVSGGVNKIYELKRGQVYFMHSGIHVDNAGGSLTIRAEAGEGPKPVILRKPLDDIPVGTNVIKGSFALQNIQFAWRATDGSESGGYWGLFSIKENNSRLLVEDCMFEMGFGVLFDTDGVENGQVSIFRNNYFRDFHDGEQWWAGRVLECKVPVDTLIFENNTCTGCGLTVIDQQCMIAFGFINHNTFINNTKYPFRNQYWKECYYTNNLFVNANWVGEDRENTLTGGSDPDTEEHGLVGVDTITIHLWIDAKYLNADSTALASDVDEISDYIWYAADNVCVYSNTLDAYYHGTPNDGIDGAPASYLNWSGLGNGPWKVIDVPGIFMNERTANMIADHNNIKAENNIVYEFPAEDMGFGTDPLPQAAADTLIEWNRAQWGVPGVIAPDIAITHFGDWDANTIPGLVDGAETEDAQTGITRISDVIEDFSYTKSLPSHIDGKPIGALHWVDMDYDHATQLSLVKDAYNGIFHSGVKPVETESLFVYPNPVKSVLNVKNAKNADITIMNLDGRIVKSVKNVSSVNVSDLADGMYAITIKEGNNVSKQKVLISKN
jgi:hypothetical protein